MYETQNFEHLLGLPGFSDQSLTTHFKLYDGYVKNTNKLIDLLKTVAPDSPEYAEAKRRFGWEFNGMRLHEYHFGAMTKESKMHGEDSALHQQLLKDFGSHEAWEKDFRATAAMRGIGWAILYFDPIAKRLFNTWINEHDLGHLANCAIILNLDVFEHAFIIDYNTNRADYITAYINAIDWSVAEERFTKAQST